MLILFWNVAAAPISPPAPDPFTNRGVMPRYGEDMKYGVGYVYGFGESDPFFAQPNG